MSKKPVVPVKRPTKGKGRGKGNDKVAKVAKAVKAVKTTKTVKTAKAVKAPRMRIIQDRHTKLIAEVDSIAKGLKGLKGGGGSPDNYYERIKGLFSEENMKNIKSLKESLVIDILGTMASGLEKLLIFKTDKTDNDINKERLLKFISIIKNIDDLIQPHIDKIIKNESLKGITYIEKITTLVMINILKKVYNSIFEDNEIKEPPFKYIENTKGLITKITEEYNGNNSEEVLKGLTEEVKRELKYYKDIHILNDYASKKGDVNGVKKIIGELKEKFKEDKEAYDNLTNFIENDFISNSEFKTSCETNQLLIKAINDYNGIIKLMKKEYSSLEVSKQNLGKLGLYNSIYTLPIDEILNYDDLLKKDFYGLYNNLIQSEDNISLISIIKKKYIECVSVFCDDTNFGLSLKEGLTDERKRAFSSVGIEEEEIKKLDELEEQIRKELGDIVELQNQLKPTLNPDAIIPINIEPLINMFNILCETNDKYDTKMKELLEKEKDIIARNEEEANELGGGKLTTKYISTGNFVYILYEKKKIKRCIYAKAKGRGKYCKIKGDYMLLSKLKVV